MKATTIILAILLLFSSLKPCSDSHNSEDLCVNEISQNHNHHDDGDDTCLIMCICSCCGTSLLYEPLTVENLSPNPKISTIVFSKFQSNYRSDFQPNIWQPPKIIS